MRGMDENIATTKDLASRACKVWGDYWRMGEAGYWACVKRFA